MRRQLYVFPKIGFQSLTDFKITISTELQTGIDEGFSDIEANESFYSIKNKLGNNAQVAIKETVDILEEETIQKVVECLESAETVFIWGWRLFFSSRRYSAKMVSCR